MIFASLRTTGFVLLDWWTFHSPVTAIHTAITLQGLEHRLAVLTFVKVLTGICRHGLFFGEAAVGTCDR